VIRLARFHSIPRMRGIGRDGNLFSDLAAHLEAFWNLDSDSVGADWPWAGDKTWSHCRPCERAVWLRRDIGNTPRQSRAKVVLAYSRL
jgi:hypothetical protein